MRDTPQDLVEAALGEVATLGLTGAALVEETATVNLRWALSGMTTNGLTSARSVTVVVVDADAVGVLARRATSLDDVRALVTDAAAVARAGQPAEDASPVVTGEALPGWDEGAGTTSAAALAGVAQALGEVFGRSRASGREAFGFALHEVVTTWLGTSGGLRYRHEQPRGTIELTAKSHGRTRSAWIGRATRDFTEVDVTALDDELATRLGWQSRTVDLAPGRYDTVLPPSAVADLMISYLWASDARSAAEGRSAFSRSADRTGTATRLGERLTAVPVSLASDPHDVALACAARVLTTASSPMASVFDNGLETPAVTWLDAGTVAALPGTRHTERLTGVPLAQAVGNLALSTPDGAGSDLDLVAGVEDGLLLTSLWYIRDVDEATLLQTGLSRDGVYRVSGGEVVGAAPNFRWNESPLDLLGRVTAAGTPEVTLGREWGEWFTRARMPALAVSGFNVSTVSEAS